MVEIFQQKANKAGFQVISVWIVIGKNVRCGYSYKGTLGTQGQLYLKILCIRFNFYGSMTRIHVVLVFISRGMRHPNIVSKCTTHMKDAYDMGNGTPHLEGAE
jgi:hypothetical protein